MSEGEPEAERWLRYAAEDLALARFVLASEALALREACWLAQQAAEKALKAGLIAVAMEVPRVHDLGRLAEMLGLDETLGLAELERLTLWSVEARCRGTGPSRRTRMRIARLRSHRASCS